MGMLGYMARGKRAMALAPDLHAPDRWKGAEARGDGDRLVASPEPLARCARAERVGMVRCGGAARGKVGP